MIIYWKDKKHKHFRIATKYLSKRYGGLYNPLVNLHRVAHSLFPFFLVPLHEYCRNVLTQKNGLFASGCLNVCIYRAPSKQAHFVLSRKHVPILEASERMCTFLELKLRHFCQYAPRSPATSTSIKASTF